MILKRQRQHADVATVIQAEAATPAEAATLLVVRSIGVLRRLRRRLRRSEVETLAEADLPEIGKSC